MSFYSRLFGVGLLLLLFVCPASAAPHHKALLDTADKFSFVVYGDTRSHPQDHRAIIQQIIQIRPEFVLQSGDLVDQGRSPAEWAEFDRITQPLRDAHIAYYPARGNHDLGPYYLPYVPTPITSGNGYYYAFTKHHNRFVIVDSFEDFDPASAQYHWLEQELAAAQKAAIKAFVMFHEGPFSVGPHGSTPEAQKYLHPLFVKYHPCAVFCGHDHLYYHTVRDEITYLVTGGGGAPLYQPENKQIAIPGDVYVSAHNVIRCDVSGSTVTVTVITPDEVTIKVPQPVQIATVTASGTHLAAPQTTPAGHILDHFTLKSK